MYVQCLYTLTIVTSSEHYQINWRCANAELGACSVLLLTFPFLLLVLHLLEMVAILEK